MSDETKDIKEVDLASEMDTAQDEPEFSDKMNESSKSDKESTDSPKKSVAELARAFLEDGESVDDENTTEESEAKEEVDAAVEEKLEIRESEISKEAEEVNETKTEDEPVAPPVAEKEKLEFGESEISEENTEETAANEVVETESDAEVEEKSESEISESVGDDDASESVETEIEDEAVALAHVVADEDEEIDASADEDEIEDSKLEIGKSEISKEAAEEEETAEEGEPVALADAENEKLEIGESEISEESVEAKETEEQEEVVNEVEDEETLAPAEEEEEIDASADEDEIEDSKLEIGKAEISKEAAEEVETAEKDEPLAPADKVDESEIIDETDEANESDTKDEPVALAHAPAEKESESEKVEASIEVEDKENEEESVAIAQAEKEAKESEEALKAKQEAEELEQLEALKFSELSKDELLEQITNIANKFSIQVHGKTLTDIKDAFDVFIDKEKEEALKYFVETGGDKEDFEFKYDDNNRQFNVYYNLIRNNRHKHHKELEKQKDVNLKLKNELLEKLREVVDDEESTGSMTALKEIQTEWKAIGPVPPQHNKTLWANYHALIDRFYDHRSIYFELKELDRRKNLEAKLELCQKAEDLDDLENFREAIQKLNELHDEFKHIGPIPKEVQDEVWDRFKTASDLIYSKRKEFVSHIKEEQQENLVKKTELSDSIADFISFTSEKITDWNSKTKALLELQKKWEAVGSMPKESAKEINRKFWGGFKTFFHNKSDFFKKLESQREGNLNLKKELVEQAEALKESTEWHKTAEILKGLQQKWREIGPVPEKYRNSIYKSFKEACDAFFNNRRQHNQGVDNEYVTNLKKKEEICEKLEKMAKAKDIKMDDIYELQDEYNEIGFVPRKNIKSIQKRYQAALNAVKNADSMADASPGEFKSLIDIHELKAGPNSDQKLNRKEHSLRRKIQALESDLDTWKNNMGFFAHSKNADELLKDFTVKIEKAEKELAEMKQELKLLQSV